MVEAPLKFRCSQCHQLLGVSPAKAGSRIACPKCAAVMTVPPPQPPPDSSAGEGEAARLIRSLLRPEPDPAPPDDLNDPLADLAATDARPGLDELPTLEFDSSELSGDQAPALAFLRSDEPPSLRPEPTPRRPSTSSPAPAGRVDLPEATGGAPAGLRVEVASPWVGRAAGPRRNDVVVPRTAVVLGAFCLLLALVFAFATGLLAGHFLWIAPDRAAVVARAAGPGMAARDRGQRPEIRDPR